METGSEQLGRKQSPKTFRARLTLATTLLAMGVLLLSDGLVYLSARQALRSNLDDALLSIARAEVASAIDGPDGAVHVHNEPAVISLQGRSGYEKFAQIENSRDQVVARTENLRGLLLQTNVNQEARARAGRIAFSDIALRGTRLRGIYYPTQDARGQPLLAIIAVSRQPMEQALGTLRLLLLASLAAGCFLAALGADRLARRLTRPLGQIAGAAHALSADDLGARIPPFSADRELLDVTEGLNGMLARLESAFAAQQRFVADASHELRSPLSNLRGTVEVALRRPRSLEEYRETLAAALTETERLSRMVAHLLTLSQADAGQFFLRREPCDLREIAAQAAAAHRVRAAEAGVSLHLSGEDALEVHGDPDRLREVVDNLLDNALRYAPRGSAVEIISQEITSETQDGRRCLCIHDAGPGLTGAEQAQVFDRFYRADPSRARQSGGLGLGLSIARAIAEAHGGSITVWSEPGAGTAFTLCLPPGKVSG